MNRHFCDFPGIVNEGFTIPGIVFSKYSSEGSLQINNISIVGAAQLICIHRRVAH